MLKSPVTSRNILTVSHLNRLARNVLETEIGQIWLSAEISNFVAASSGHWYFTLKDEKAQVKSAMFKGANRRVLSQPKAGDKVLVRANIGLYEPRGDYQLIVEHIEPEGEGQLKQQFEKLKAQLVGQGLFEQKYKQAIPEHVSTVGIVTSPTGAALHDILTVLKRRNPAIEVVIYPSLVQGDSAAQHIASAIQCANERKEVDILIVGRGGGSLEDLFCFNDEALARTIFASSLPIISAVGHEVDISIADFVADLRAATPSAAAELVSRDKSVLTNNIVALEGRMTAFMGNLHSYVNQRQQSLEQRLLLNHPQKQLQQKSQYIDQLQDKLQAKLQARLIVAQQRQHHVQERLMLASPDKAIQAQQLKLRAAHQLLHKSCQRLLEEKRQQLANNSHLLDNISPLATLSRGYSISFKQGEIVKSVKQVQRGDMLTSRFSDGEVDSKVQ
jgi:exodeoxyribonuclease VII large subunit